MGAMMRLASELLLVAALACATPLSAQSGPPATTFAPPESPMLLTRTVERTLFDGKLVRARRTYEIRFLPDSGGYRIEGKLLSVKVEVPAKLEALAALERARPDTGLFPMRLDAEGRLLAGKTERAATLDPRAQAAARAMIRSADLSRSEARTASAFVDGIARSPTRTEWPVDLFRPATGARRASSQGNAGAAFIVDIEADADDRTGLLSDFVRRVTTRLGGRDMVATERWTLAPIG
ncbi:hypothetical protein B2G71_13580 [Novosphingobium sp. PC22D]|uniref:hypothetical protein n=1 Tax=Novosphingobium sp. PC22D TaxID=1962403 RepID=UPI000BF058ED|nr:hypothetical protein [Novosphingobium sp. PC22D]PEQ12166.1 hypothetical protein B2G71_13580 [Novosphingobium sp. PC22D]